MQRKRGGCAQDLAVAAIGWVIVVFGAAGIMTLLGHHPDDYGCAPLCVIIIGPAFGFIAARYLEAYLEHTKDREPNSKGFKRQLAWIGTDEEKIKRIRQRAERKNFRGIASGLVTCYGKDHVYEAQGLRFTYTTGGGENSIRYEVTIHFNGKEVYRDALGYDTHGFDRYGRRYVLGENESSGYYHSIDVYIPGEWEEICDQVVKAAEAKQQQEIAGSIQAAIEDKKKRFGL